jgi:hypothetical protein
MLNRPSISFIITCYNREAYLPYLINILKSYRTKVNWVICYNGNKNIKCDFYCKNRGKHRGDFDLIQGGYNLVKNTNFRFIKLSCDSWLLEEEAIMDIFRIMETNKCCYGGSFWHNTGKLATDVFFADVRFGNVFKTLGPPNSKNSYQLEISMATAAQKAGKSYIIPQRPMMNGTPEYVGYRVRCDALGWCMYHQLEKNLKFVKEYRVKKLY